MGRIITLSSLAILITPLIVLSPEVRAQQTNLSQVQRQRATFRQTQDAATAAAAGHEFCPRTPCPGFTDNMAIQRSMLLMAPTLTGQAKTSGPWPPNPHQYTPSEREAMARAQTGDYAPGIVERHEYQIPIYRGKLIPAQELEKRSYEIFPRAVLDVDENSKRVQWLVDQEQRAIANEINSTKPLIYPVSGR
jgi:hypothetical protein